MYAVEHSWKVTFRYREAWTRGRRKGGSQPRLTSGVFVRKFRQAGTYHGAGMGISVGAPRGAGGRLGVVRRSVVADGPLEADALLALEQALRVDLGLDRLELREAVRAPGVLLHGDALLFAFRVRKTRGTKRRVVGLEGAIGVLLYVVVLRASEDLAFRGLRVAFGDFLWPGSSESVSWWLMLVVYPTRLYVWACSLYICVFAGAEISRSWINGSQCLVYEKRCRSRAVAVVAARVKSAVSYMRRDLL